MKSRHLTGKMVPMLAIAGVIGGAAFGQSVELWRATGFNGPESVAQDAATGVIYVANMGPDLMAHDGDGYIAILGRDGTITTDKWLIGLDAPKGMDIVGGTLFTADIDTIVEIDIASASIRNRYKVEGAKLLNDVTAAPDGRVFVSDTFANTIYVLDGGVVSLFLTDPMLMGINGLTVIDGALIGANLGDISEGFDKIKPSMVVRVDLATKALSAFGADGPVGILDGIEPDGKGGVIVTDYMAGKVLSLLPGATATEIATLSLGAADLEVSLADGMILVPITPENTVVALSLTK